MAAEARETEIKYEAMADTRLPRFDELPQVARTRAADTEQLDAEYFDTADLRLLRAGITLRRREGGHDAGWHLKLPAGSHTRREISLPLPKAAGQRQSHTRTGHHGAGHDKAGRAGQLDQQVPEELARLVRVHSRAGELRPVARISTRRQRLQLLDPAGASLAEVASDEVHARAIGGIGETTAWREVEVELTGGDVDVLAAADRLLRSEGLSRSDQSPKLARALGLPQAGLRAVSRRAAAAPPASAGQALADYLAEQVITLMGLDPMVRGGEPDSVHQMRTTIRRIRSAFRSFAVLFSERAVGPLDAELRWLGAMLGEARDAEVLADHMAGQLHALEADEVAGPVADRTRDHFARCGADADTRVLESLDSARYFALLDQLDLLVTAPPLSARAARPADEALRPPIRRAYARTRRRLRRALAQPAGDARNLALHRARKAAKRARYAGEVAAGSFGKDASRFARQMKRVQSVLGEHQDAVIARRVERDLGMSAHRAGENAFSYGLIYERDGQQARRLVKQASRVWRKASRPRFRRWLG